MSTKQVLIIEGGYRGRRMASRVPGAADHTLPIDDPKLPEAAARGGQLVVCGGSPAAIEAATEFAEIYPGLRVSLVTLDVFGAKGPAGLRESFRRLGIEILDQLEIVRVSPNALHFDGGRPMYFDVAVWDADNERG